MVEKDVNKADFFIINDSDDILDCLGVNPENEFNVFGDGCSKRSLDPEEEPAKKQKGLVTNNEKVDPDEKALVKGTKPFLFCMYGKPGEGKSALAQYVVYEKLRTKAVDYVIVVKGSSWNDDWRWLPEEAIKTQWTEDIRQQIIEAQTQEDRGHLCLVLDDQAGSFPWDDDSTTELIIKYRQYNTSIIITMQYVYKIPPVIRECSSHAAIFKQTTKRSKEALYDTYGGDWEKKDDFYRMLKDNTGNYYFVYFEGPFYRWFRTKIEPIPSDVKIKSFKDYAKGSSFFS